MRALILEDNRDRRVAMIGRLAERFPFLHVVFFDTSATMIDFMKFEPLQDVAVIALDNDLEMIPGPEGNWIDPGTGLDIARYLADRPKPLCPIIVHTTNSRAGFKMMHLLEKSGWAAYRVIPHNDLNWIETDWFQVVRNAIVAFTPQRFAYPVIPVGRKVNLIRSLLNRQEENAQEFCRAAIAKIVDAYVHDLQQTVGNVSVEVFTINGNGKLNSILELEGRFSKWIREDGIAIRPLINWANRGPLGIELLKIGEDSVHHLFQWGIKQIQVGIFEIAKMQAMYVISAEKNLSSPITQEIITELTEAFEIVLFVSLHWSRSRNLSKGTTVQEKKSNPETQPQIKGTPNVEVAH